MIGAGTGKTMNIKAMTDFERTEEFLTIMGIGFKVKDGDSGRNVDCATFIKVSERYNGNQGYLDFFCNYEFDEDGKLLEFGIWE